MQLENLTQSEEFIIKWQYQLLGGFKTHLAHAIAKADKENLARLEKGFPNEVEGYKNFTRKPGWWQEAQKKAGIPEGDI